MPIKQWYISRNMWCFFKCFHYVYCFDNLSSSSSSNQLLFSKNIWLKRTVAFYFTMKPDYAWTHFDCPKMNEINQRPELVKDYSCKSTKFSKLGTDLVTRLWARTSKFLRFISPKHVHILLVYASEFELSLLNATVLTNGFIFSHYLHP